MAPGTHILVIDDDPFLLRAIRLILALEDFVVQTAGDGLEGLTRVDSTRFDLIILDLQMPRMDGRTFYRELRARGYSMPVLILSAFGAARGQAELQAESSLAKPFDPDVLVARVRGMLPASLS